MPDDLSRPAELAEPPTSSEPSSAAAASVIPEAAVQFDDLNLSPPLREALRKAGYDYPTPIQAGLIPRALDGADLLGQARTGTGKTASFVIPILQRLEHRKPSDPPQALILVPTRELAVQVKDEVEKLAHGQKVHCVAVYGGKPLRQQMEKLRRGAEIVVGTPGRVIDLLGRGALQFNELRCVVLDEADRMLDIGFRPDIEKILRRCPKERQTLLLSATVPPPIQRLAQRYMHEPESLNFSPKDVSVETIEQFYFTVDAVRKFDLLVRLIDREDPKQMIVFCRTKRGTEKVMQRLQKKFESVGGMHGDMIQRARDKAMASFRESKIRFLVATDVVGRGIDVSGVSHIVNYDIPEFCDDYVHRVGRTGRMGREGVAYTFVTPEEGPQLTRIEIRINRLLKRDEMPEFDALAPAPTHLEDGAFGAGLAAAPGQAAPAVKPPPAPSSIGGRGPKRYRRAL